MANIRAEPCITKYTFKNTDGIAKASDRFLAVERGVASRHEVVGPVLELYEVYETVVCNGMGIRRDNGHVFSRGHLVCAREMPGKFHFFYSTRHA